MMRVAWFCGLPKDIQQQAFPGAGMGPTLDWSWIVGHLPPPLGIELHIVAVSRRIRHRLHAHSASAQFHVLPVLPGGACTFYWNWVVPYRQWTREFAPDCVHGWGTEAGYGIAAIKSGRPYVVGIQGLLAEYWPHMPHRLMLRLGVWNERRTLRQARCVVAEGDYSKQAGAPYTPAAIQIVPHPLRPAFVAAAPGARDTQTMVFLGAAQKRKGFSDALRAFARLPGQDWTLVCLGAIAPGERAAVESLIEQLGIASRVKLAGASAPAEVVQWLQRSPVLLLPSYIDTGPTALKEALAMGVWPVCYDNSGPRELINRYQFGSLTPTGNVDALAQALQQVVSTKPWLAADRAAQCAAAIRRDLDHDRIWELLVRLYKERLRQTGARD